MNGTMIQFFNWYTDGDSFLWKHTKDQATNLSDLGITAAWLPPAYKSTNAGFSVGYDPYDLFDLGEFDQKGGIPTKYGTKDQYLEAVKALKENKIQVISPFPRDCVAVCSLCSPCPPWLKFFCVQ